MEEPEGGIPQEPKKEDNKYTRMAVMASICIGVVFFLGMIVFIATKADESASSNISYKELFEQTPGYHAPIPNFTVSQREVNLSAINATSFYGYLNWSYTNSSGNQTQGYGYGG
jgi:hypothetical protein